MVVAVHITGFQPGVHLQSFLVYLFAGISASFYSILNFFGVSKILYIEFSKL
jgi:hypothetical protein